MTEQQLFQIIARRMAYVEQELTTDPPCTDTQFINAMTDYAKELARLVKLEISGPAAPAVVATQFQLTEGQPQPKPPESRGPKR